MGRKYQRPQLRLRDTVTRMFALLNAGHFFLCKLHSYLVL